MGRNGLALPSTNVVRFAFALSLSISLVMGAGYSAPRLKRAPEGPCLGPVRVSDATPRDVVFVASRRWRARCERAGPATEASEHLVSSLRTVDRSDLGEGASDVWTLSTELRSLQRSTAAWPWASARSPL